MMILTLLWLSWANSATARELLIACPGRSVSLNCSVEPIRASIFWSIWCECRAGSSGSCRDTCSSMESTLSSTRDRHNTGSVCASTGDSPVITYSNNFTTIVDQNGNMFVPFSALTITIPIEFQSLNTRLCLTCEDQLNRHFLVPGLPSHPKNLLFYPQYTTATDTEVIVNFVWSPEPELSAQDDDIEYLIIFLDDTDSFNSSYRTTVSNLTVALEFNKIYSIMIYTSRCDGALTSVHPLSRNITIDRDSSCPLPCPHPNVNVNIIVAGSLLSFQCREGLVPEERLEAVCGPEGIWTPDPTLHTCMNGQEDNSSCSLPRTHLNVNISIIVAGSLLSFQCKKGLVPAERLEAVCGPEGIWSPDPTLHVCMNSQEDTTVLDAEKYVYIFIGALTGLTLLGMLGCSVLLAKRLCLRQKKQEKRNDSSRSEIPEIDGTEGMYSVLNYKERKMKVLGANQGYQRTPTTVEVKGREQNYNRITLESMGVEVMEADTCNSEYAEIGNHESINFSGQYDQIQATPPLSHTKPNNSEYSEISSHSALSENAHASNTSTASQMMTPSAVYSVVKTNSNALSEKVKIEKLKLELGTLVGALRERSYMWRRLAGALKVPQEQLEVIEGHCQSDFDSLVEVCDAWLSLSKCENTLPALQDVISALQEAGEEDFAEQLLAKVSTYDCEGNP